MNQEEQRAHLREALQSLYNGWLVAQNAYVKYACTSQAFKYLNSSETSKIISKQEDKLLRTWINNWGQSQKLSYTNREFVETVPSIIEIMKRVAEVSLS